MTRRKEATTSDESDAHEIISLLFDVIAAGGADFETTAAGFGLNPVQARALLFLEQPSPMRVVAEHLRCDASYVTDIADGLEQRGLVERRAAESDRRVKLLVPTPRGEALRDDLRAAFRERSPLLARLTREERRRLKDLLRRLVATSAE